MKSASANEKSKFIFVRRAKNAKMECALCRRPSVCNGTSRLRAPGDGEIYVCVEMLNGITLIDARRTHTTAPKRMDKMEISFNHATTKSQYIFISMEYEGEPSIPLAFVNCRLVATLKAEIFCAINYFFHDAFPFANVSQDDSNAPRKRNLLLYTELTDNIVVFGAF